MINLFTWVEQFGALDGEKLNEIYVIGVFKTTEDNKITSQEWQKLYKFIKQEQMQTAKKVLDKAILYTRNNL